MAKFENCTGYLATESGAWFPVARYGTIETSSAYQAAEFVSALGRRTVYTRGAAPRTWTITAQAPWAWVQGLKALAALPQQRLYWLSPLGLHTNALISATPANGSKAGVMEVAGLPVEVYTAPGGYVYSSRQPVLPGATVQASAVLQSGRVFMEFRSAAGAMISREGHTPGGKTLGEVTTPPVKVPATAQVVSIVVENPALTGRLALMYEDHGMAAPSESECAWVTLEEIKVSHGNIAFKHSPISFTCTLKEVA